ncbi:hypothetical protein ACK8GG_12365 [Micromonosporaceae bacterium DT55]|uniref:hypothetical protein n=1 Tax=Melissospora conviva TaxID=3388432 RepID=UPI003C266C7C
MSSGPTAPTCASASPPSSTPDPLAPRADAYPKLRDPSVPRGPALAKIHAPGVVLAKIHAPGVVLAKIRTSAADALAKIRTSATDVLAKIRALPATCWPRSVRSRRPARTPTHAKIRATSGMLLCPGALRQQYP